MITWRLERLLRLGPLLGLVTFALPVAMAYLVAGASSVDDVLGALLVASLIIGLGSLIGSTAMAGVGAFVFGAMSVIAETGAVGLFAVGTGLLATLVLHDLASSLRRDPRFSGDVIMAPIAGWVIIVGLAAAMYALTFQVATLTRWQALLLPCGIVAIGFAARLAVDSHGNRVKDRA